MRLRVKLNKHEILVCTRDKTYELQQIVICGTEEKNIKINACRLTLYFETKQFNLK
jgi:hypothetical protein